MPPAILWFGTPVIFMLSRSKGFTLVEIMVAVSIFAIVAVVAVAALLTANRINRKAQATKLVMDNLNFAMDSILFKLKKGSGYYCFTDGEQPDESPIPYDGTKNCPEEPGNANDGGSAIATTYVSEDQQFFYRLNETDGRGEIQFATPGNNFVAITSPAIDIDRLKFYVDGAGSRLTQPRVLITVYGTAQVGQDSTDFALETAVTERR